MARGIVLQLFVSAVFIPYVTHLSMRGFRADLK